MMLQIRKIDWVYKEFNINYKQIEIELMKLF